MQETLAAAPAPVAVVAVRRRLVSLKTGANVYLSVLLEELRQAGFAVHLVFAPESSFGEWASALVGESFVSRCDRISWSGTARFGRLFISLSPRVWGRFLRRLVVELGRAVGGAVGGTAPNAPSRSGERLPAGEMRALAATIDRLAPRLVVAEYSALGGVLAHVSASGAVHAILLHDLFSMRAASMRAAVRPTDFADITLAEESGDCEPADLLIYASLEERAVLAPRLPGRAHHWLAPRRPFRAATLADHAEESVGGVAKALFMGVRHGGNLDALEFLMTEIWPLVIRRRPEAELCIVGEIGASLRPEWRRLDGVRVLGVVGDLSAFGGPDVIGLAPTRVASGISIKVADYLSLGMPVVASFVAIDGYGDNLHGGVETADDAASFAARVEALMADPTLRRELAARGRAAARAGLDNTALREALRAIAAAPATAPAAAPHGADGARKNE